MKKIMFYINTIGYGGAERVITNLAERFAQTGHEVTLVTSYALEKEYPYSENVKRIILSPVRFKSWLERNLVLTKRLRNAVAKINPDVLVSFMGENNFRAVVSCACTKTSCVVSVRNDPNKEYPNKVFKFFAKFLYRFSDGVVLQTKDAMEWFPKLIQKKSQIILNQVDKQFYDEEYDGEHKDIVTTGRLVSQKNHELLIDAFAKIADDIQDNLYIYGEGTHRKKLEDKIQSLGLSNRVFMPGATSKVSEVVGKSKLFVLSSDYEGMPNSLMEAMVLGTACVSTDCPCGGPAYLINSMKNGILVPVKDVESMSYAIKMLLQDDDLRKKMGLAAKEKAMLFHPDVIYKEWENFLKGVCDK